ncbi:MAG: arginine deiminase-related protein [Cyclobacteriaceae bacterium]
MIVTNMTQSVSTILMVRPANFGFNEQTAESNAFQSIDNEHSEREVSKLAKVEFDGFVTKLRDHGISVVVHEEDYHPDRTDAVFPNNWISFHENGRVIIYPMEAPNRRLEKDKKVLELLRSNFEINTVQDLGDFESKNQFLEGTGSIIFDYIHGKGYACRSTRTDDQLFTEVCTSLGYEAVLFEASDPEGIPIYHTNVMMALGTGYVVICMDSVKDADQKTKLMDSFAEDGLEIIDIEFDQLANFAGNMLEVRNAEDQRHLVMSKSAFDSLRKDQIDQIEKYAKPLWVDISTIENTGGGSARCMMAAVHLPKKS